MSGGLYPGTLGSWPSPVMNEWKSNWISNVREPIFGVFSIDNRFLLSKAVSNSATLQQRNDITNRHSDFEAKSQHDYDRLLNGTPSHTQLEVNRAALDHTEDEVKSINIPSEVRFVSNLQILERISDPATLPRDRLRLVCRAELIRFEDADRDKLLETLWRYIQDNRSSDDRDELVAVGSAIRKYIANIPMDKMGMLSELLEPWHRAPLPLLLELEVAKMIYHNFEVFPPKQPDPHPELATRLWEMAKVYMNPQVILREDYGTVAALAVAAIIAMRSEYATEAWRAAMAIPHRWFGMLVRGDIDELHDYWLAKDVNAANWLEGLRTERTGATG